MESKQVNMLLGVIIMILVGIIGLLLLQNSHRDRILMEHSVVVPKDSVQVQPPVMDTVPLDDGQSSSDTISWKTYTSSQYGFSVQYPADFPIDTGKSGKNNSIFTLSLNYTRPTTDGGGQAKYLWISAEPKRALTECEGRNMPTDSIGIGGSAVQKCIIQGSYFGQGNGLLAEVTKGNYTYTFSADYYDEHQAIVDKILSTFNFTK